MFVICLLLWIILSAHFTLETGVAGILVAGVVYRFCRRHLGYSLRGDLRAIRKVPAVLKYIGILVWETARSNIQVSRLVFARKIEVSPRIIFFRTELKSEAARVTLANSITLTPGTITVSLTDDVFCVHCLDKGMAEGIGDSQFVRQLRQIEGE